MSRDGVSEFYRKSRILCCTSDFEGFPNTFLEAWSYGVPTVSTFDPDNLIAAMGLGKVCRNISDLAAGIRELLDVPERWDMASRAARQYYVENHAVDRVMELFEGVFLDAAQDTLLV